MENARRAGRVIPAFNIPYRLMVQRDYFALTGSRDTVNPV